MKLTGEIKKDSMTALTGEAMLRGGRKIPRIWVLVADGGIARIFRKPNAHLEMIGEAFPGETMQADLTNKTLGRGIKSGAGGSVRHKYEPHMEAARQDSKLFAQEIADWLETAVQAEAFDKLVLVAAPRTLGDLRLAMARTVQERIVAEVDKDLTGLDEKALRDALDDVLWF